MHEENYLKWHDKHGKARPVHIPHGTPDELQKITQKLLPKTWTLQGNLLRGMTEMGELVQRIPTDYILEGVDDEGLPRFKKVVTLTMKEPTEPSES